MPAYKRQHYLPAVYLKNFTLDGAHATRSSNLWRIDPSRCVSVTVESQCAEDFMFSRKEPKKTEEMFQQIEGRYGAAVRKIWTGEDPKVGDSLALILTMIELHARNAVHQNLTGHEGVDAYNRRLDSFFTRMLLEMDASRSATPEEIRDHLKQHWRVRLLRTAENMLLTSDHPSQWLSWDKSNESVAVDFILMPVTGFMYAIAYDRRRSKVRGNSLTESDEIVLATNQIHQCGEAVYMAEKPTDDVVWRVRKEWKDRVSPTTRTDLEKWDLNVRVPPREDMLSFLRRAAPT
jgi:uncharacterized protein DUF4238